MKTGALHKENEITGIFKIDLETQKASLMKMENIFGADRVRELIGDLEATAEQFEIQKKPAKNLYSC